MVHRYEPTKLWKKRITKNPRIFSRKKNDLVTKNKIICKDLITIDMDEGLGKPSDVKKRLQKMELLACNLMFQLILCVFAVIFTVTVYFLKYQSSKCWALPFQESPCKRSRALPSIATNQSTLSDAVDELVLALQTEISAFYSVAEVPFTLLRQSLFTFTKIKIGQLLNQHSADLVGFGALKREDERLEELELAIEEGYFQIFNFQYALIIFLLCFVAIPIVLLNFSKPAEKRKQMKSSAEESENSENIRLKKLKRRIPLLYIATFLCIAVELVLFFGFVAGAYHGNSPVFRSCDVLRHCKVKVSFSNSLSFSTELESNLDKRIAELGTSMGSPNLEVRQLTYKWQSEAISAAIEHHLGLKRYNVDRRTMPRKIGIVLPDPKIIPLGISIILFDCLIFFVWVDLEDSVWQVFPCIRFLIRCCNAFHRKIKTKNDYSSL